MLRVNVLRSSVKERREREGGGEVGESFGSSTPLGSLQTVRDMNTEGADLVHKSTFESYYKHMFPASHVFKLFSRTWQDKKYSPECREYGTETIDGIFRRWKCCSNEDDLRTLVSAAEIGKLNIGAVFKQQIWMRWKLPSNQSMIPLQREFVIDIDLDDYSSGAVSIDKNDLQQNDRMWPLVAIGILICKDILKEAFGFSQFLVVYSGRRGAHLWVLDQRACELTDEARAAIIKFITPSDKMSESGRKYFSWLLQHPNFGSGPNPLEASEIGMETVFQRFVYKFFVNYAIKPLGEKNGLGLLDSRFDREHFIKMADLKFSDQDVGHILNCASGVAAFDKMQYLISLQPEALRKWTIVRMCETICTMVWPRPDVAVSTHMNHTLKAPYSVHPKTGRISIPVFNTDLIDFDPSIDSPLASSEMPYSFAENVSHFAKFVSSMDVMNSVGGVGGEDGEDGNGDGNRSVTASGKRKREE